MCISMFLTAVEKPWRTPRRNVPADIFYHLADNFDPLAENFEHFANKNVRETFYVD